MKALSMYVWSLLVIMMMGLTSCGDDDETSILGKNKLAYIKQKTRNTSGKKKNREKMRWVKLKI